MSIRKQRYPYQPKDIVEYNGQRYIVKGVQNCGAYVKLAELSKPVRIELVKPVRYNKGLCVV